MLSLELPTWNKIFDYVSAVKLKSLFRVDEIRVGFVFVSIKQYIYIYIKVNIFLKYLLGY